MDIHTHIHWVPGNIEVEGNEKADQLAKKGTEDKRTLWKLFVRYNHSERKNQTKFFAKTLSHCPKPLFFSFTPSF
jgi:ribonuclease HI